ncbi:MAG: endonuclease/exonuclease/phosphatase family protein [Acidimicrobiales bacterium]
MRLATFNVHHGTVGRRGPVDLDRLGEVCAGFEADVLCLQEVDVGTYRARGADLAAAVGRATGMDHAFGASRWFPGGRYGNAVLVRGAIAASTVVALPRVPSWRVWQERRTALLVDAVLDDGPLRVVGTHLAVRRGVNEVQLERLLAWAGAGPPPTAVLGDLNRTLGSIEAATVAAGLPAVAHPPTFPAAAPSRTIDHVLLSPDLEALAVEVRPTPMSDHAALLVDVRRRGS